ncbi:MAG TPA: response regulator [Desulfuromonadales bacterium]|nr:response regulator [Desulfuromonadales bacterium]
MNDALLFVDDEPDVLSALRRALLDEPYEILTVQNAEEALAILKQQPIKVIVSDERMPGMSGADFLTTARETYPQTVRILLTGHASLESTRKAVNSGGIYRFFTKPWDEAELILGLREAVAKYDLQEENRRLLRTVRRQSQEFKALEAHYPGISSVRKDQTGTYLLPELSENEVAAVIERCNREYENL